MGRPRNDSFIGGDDRLKKSDRSDDRSSSDLDRTDTDGTAFTAQERRKMLRAEWAQEKLPTPPNLAGWHMCWLSTTSSYDPIARRIRMGYVPVKVDEVPGFEKLHMTGGEWDGHISCNEMLLFKIPLDIYQEVMSEFHHHMPLEGEQGIKQDIRSQGADIEVEKGAEDGFGQMAKTHRTPHFA
jgi:hypothetical protein